MPGDRRTPFGVITRAMAVWALASFLPALGGDPVIPRVTAVETPLATAAIAPIVEPPDNGFTVLCYHRFVSHPEWQKLPLSMYRLPVAEFRWQMQYLKEHGIVPISLEQLKAYWFEGKPLPDKAVLLTFDDGFNSIYHKAYPVFRKFGYPGVLFLYTDFIRGQKDSLHYTEIAALQRAGIAVESHTKSHLNLGLEEEKIQASDFNRLLDEELSDPLTFINEKFNHKATTLAYPYGVYDDVIVQKTREKGYQLAFTVNRGPNDRTVPPLKLRRYLVLFPLEHEKFGRIFENKVLHLEKTYPYDGQVISSEFPKISAEILDDIVPASLDLHLGDHRMVFHYNPQTKTLIHQVKAKLRPGGHMLILTAKDVQGNRRIYSWYFRLKHKNLKPQKEETNDAY